MLTIRSCRCGFQFCYICGSKWKSCGCAHWDEHRLIERAEQIDRRNQEARPVGLQNVDGNVNVQQGERQIERHRQQRVRALMGHLRVNHECEHGHWGSRQGPHQCEVCDDVMPIFIYECRQCQIMACRRCRYNRL